jgi:hypothetical protein
VTQTIIGGEGGSIVRLFSEKYGARQGQVSVEVQIELAR